MAEPENAPRPSTPVRQTVLMGLFAGTAVGSGYLLAGVPPVELMSLMVAVSGAVLGARRGFLVGALSAAVHSLGSPYGLPAPLMLAAQMAGMGCAGPIGKLVTRGGGAAAPMSMRGAPWRAAAGGLAITVILDALTNLASLGMFDLPAGVVLAGAVPFFLIHAVFNLVFFATLLPALAARLAPLAHPRVTGSAGWTPVIACLCLGLAADVAIPTSSRAQDAPATLTAPPDSTTAVAAAPPLPPGPNGWRRGLWRPFDATYLSWVDRWSPWVSLVDGGVGAEARLLGEAGTSPMPLVVRDGIPLGTGHALADDAWLLGVKGMTAASGGLGSDGWGGSGGLVNLSAREDDPLRGSTSYHGVKGPHETYHRSVDFLTPHSDWRVGFSFEETLDNEGYNHTLDDDLTFAGRREDGLTGQGKVRLSRTRLLRSFADGAELAVEVGMGRRTRDDLPSLGAGSLEAWDRSGSVSMRWLAGGWDLRQAAFWSERDVQWGTRYDDPHPDLRLLETGRQGLRLDIRRRASAANRPDTLAATGEVSAAEPLPPTAGSMAASDPTAAGDLPLLSLTVLDWHVHDSGTTAAWAAADTGSIIGKGDELRGALGWSGRLAGAATALQLGVLWGSGPGLGPDCTLRLAQQRAAPLWKLSLEWNGRAPRSDELLTPLKREIDGRELVLLPEAGLQREKSARAALDLAARPLGLDLALTASARGLTDGVAWRAGAGAPEVGRWTNELDLKAWAMTLRLAHAGRFLGWARIAAEGTWQGFDVAGGPRAGLPPEDWQRLRLDWENHFFREDGILEVSLLSTRRGPVADPWDVTGSYLLPTRTNHDLLVGFRLVGTHLTLGIRNLTGQRQQMTSGAWSPGTEMDMRLDWSFRQ